MEQFSLEKYLANPLRKVVTREGQNVRIICTDRKDLNFPIIALIENKSGLGETTIYYTKDGKFYINGSTDFDLFFAPEKHEGWVNIYPDEKIGELYCEYVFHSEEEARKNRGKGAIATSKIEWEE